MNKLFTDDRTPFLLSLLLAFAAYHFNQIVNNLISAPIIEYKSTVLSANESNGTIFKVREYSILNLTNTKSFQDLTISFRFKNLNNNNNKIYHPIITAIHPSSPADNLKDELPDSTMIEFTITQLQPGFKYLLKFNTKTKEDKDDEPLIFLTSKEAVKLLEGSITTFLIRNQLIINVIMLFIWITLIGFYTVKLYKNEATTNPSTSIGNNKLSGNKPKSKKMPKV